MNPHIPPELQQTSATVATTLTICTRLIIGQSIPFIVAASILPKIPASTTVPPYKNTNWQDSLNLVYRKKSQDRDNEILRLVNSLHPHPAPLL